MDDTLDSDAGEKQPLLQEHEEKKDIHEQKENSGKTKRWVTVEPLLVVYFAATIAGTGAFIQQWIYSKVAQSYNYTDPNSARNSSDSSCVIQNGEVSAITSQIQMESSFWMVVILSSDILPAIVMTILLGSYSDQVGRKVALVPALFGSLFRASTFLVVIVLDLPIYVTIVGAVVEGISGGPGTVLAACFSYVTDVTTDKQRTVRFVLIQVCIGIGTTVANISVGFLISAVGFYLPATIVTALYLLIVLYAIFLLPETIQKDKNATLFSRRNFSAALLLFTKGHNTGRRWKLLCCLLFSFLFISFDTGASEIVTFVLLNPPLCLGSIDIGIYNGYAFMFKGLASLVLAKLLARRLPEFILVLLGCFSGACYFFFMAVVTTHPNLLFVAPLLASASVVSEPTIKAISSTLVDPGDTGALFSVFSWTQLLSALVGTVLFNAIYTLTLTLSPGFVFVVASALFVLPAVVAVILWIGISREAKIYVSLDVDVETETMQLVSNDTDVHKN